MADSRQLLWQPIAVASVVAIVIGISLVARWQAPPNTLRARVASERSEVTIAAESPCASWRTVLTFTDDPGTSWICAEQPAVGNVHYQLRFDADDQALYLERPGAPVPVLAGIRVSREPSEVIWQRSLARLVVRLDGERVMAVRDCFAGGPAQGMTLTQSVTRAAPVIIEFHDQSHRINADLVPLLTMSPHQLRQAIPGLELDDPAERAWWWLRLAWLELLRRETAPGADPILLDPQAVMDAAVGDTLTEYPRLRDHEDLRVWLAAAQAIEATAQDDLSGARAALVDGLLRQRYGSLLVTSVGAEALARLTRCDAVYAIGDGPIRDRLARRDYVLGLVQRVAADCLDVPQRAPPRRRWELELLIHAIRAWRGHTASLSDYGLTATGGPPPAQAPLWVGERWRLLSMGLPSDTNLPPLPEQLPGEGLRLTVDQVWSALHLDPLRLTSARIRLRILLDQASPFWGSVRQITEEPLEEPYPLLMRALLALRNPEDMNIRAIRHDLALPDRMDGRSWRQRHHLAYALDRLLADRYPRLTDGGPPVLIEPPRDLALAAPWLLGGRDTILASGTDPASMPPLPEALAAALIMEAVDGEFVDWSILGQVPSYQLPLECLVPPGSP